MKLGEIIGGKQLILVGSFNERSELFNYTIVLPRTPFFYLTDSLRPAWYPRNAFAVRRQWQCLDSYSINNKSRNMTQHTPKASSEWNVMVQRKQCISSGGTDRLGRDGSDKDLVAKFESGWLWLTEWDLLAYGGAKVTKSSSPGRMGFVVRKKIPSEPDWYTTQLGRRGLLENVLRLSSRRTNIIQLQTDSSDSLR